MSNNKSQLWLITLLLVSPTQTDQTVIKLPNESEDKTIDIKITDDRKETEHIPYDYKNYLTYVDFNKQTTNESYLRIANYSSTNKEKESDINDTKLFIDTVVSTEDDNDAFGKDIVASTPLVEAIKHVQGNHDKEDGFGAKINENHYIIQEKESQNNKYFIPKRINDNLEVKQNTHSDRVNRKLLNSLGSQQRRDEDLKVEQRDIDNAVDHGMRALEDLIKVKEPLLYKLGLFLDDDSPAARVAKFGAPISQKALLMSQIGYATLEASRKIAETYPKNVGRQSAGIPIELQSRIELDECPLRGRPRCPPGSRRFRTSDGTCNNLEHPWRGSAMLPMQRFLLPVYEDGIQSVRRSVLGPPLPSPRKLSTVVHRDKNQEIQSVTLMFMQWGQFIDHDITSTVKSRSFNGSIPRCCEGGGRRILPPELLHPSCLPIEVPRTDPFLSRFGIGCMEFLRSAPSTRIDCELGWREQINQVTPYIDASTIYGSDVHTSDSIRTFRNGQIFYGRPVSEDMNPPDPPGGEVCREGALSEECLQPGDGRVSENPGLVAMHTVFVRYHNKVASMLSNINSHWSDERVYQETRKIVYSVIQHITYREYLPIVLGPEVMDLFELRILKKGYYDKYDSKANPAIANSFSTTAFRFGHSMVQNSYVRTDSHHMPILTNVTLHNEITNFENIWSVGSVDRFLLGMANQPSQKRDEFMAEELTNHLFQFSDSTPFGMDLAAINIQRGRDHGIPPYTSWRKPCGLSPIKDWLDLEQVISISAAVRLRSIYAHVDDLDLFTAGLAEKPLRGAVVGPTFACIIAQQFSNLRKGDRFWYENEAFESSFPPAQLQQIRKVSLSQIMCQTMDEMETIQPFVFLSSDRSRNVRVSCDSPEIRNFNLGAWAEEPFEFNSISDNLFEVPDSFELERSQTDFTDLTRMGRYNNDNRPLSQNKILTDRLDLNTNDTLLTMPKNKQDIPKTKPGQPLMKNPTDIKQVTNKINNQTLDHTVIRITRDISNRLKTIKTKPTTGRTRHNMTKTKTNTRTKTTTPIPNQTSKSKTITSDLKYNNFGNLPKKPVFSGYSTTKRTKNKPTYYQILDNDHDDVTYLLGIVPERSTKPTLNPQLQVNINIQYTPQASSATVPTTLKKKRPNYNVRPSSAVTNQYVTARPTFSNIYKPTQTYQDDIIVITRRPETSIRPSASSTRRPSSKKPEVISYPVFVHSSTYDKPSDYGVPTKNPSYFYDIEYASTTGHKRPNNNGLGLTDNYDSPRPISGDYSIGDVSYGTFVNLPHTSYRPTTGYYSNNNDNYDQDREPIYISGSNYQHSHTSYESPVFEERPFASSNNPTNSNSNKYSNNWSANNRPTYSSHYVDDNSDTVVITRNKKRPQTNGYNRVDDTSTDDILNEFFHRRGENTDRQSSSNLIDDSKHMNNINDKLDFKSRVVHQEVNNKNPNSDRFVQISAVKKEVIISREGEDDVKEKLVEENFQRKPRIVKNIRVMDVDITPSDSSGEWKYFNTTEDSTPYVEVPVLLTTVPCSDEVPKPMTEFMLSSAERSRQEKNR